MRVLVTGVGGLLGSALVSQCQSAGDEVLPFDHKSLDISNKDAVTSTVLSTKPDVIVNCAAYTDVDRSEIEWEQSHATNALGPENLAHASRAVNASLITISTDYVFDGTKDGFYTQEDQPNPQSAYARGKYEGEQRARQANPRTMVVRAAMIFGPGGRNYLSTVIDRARRGETLKAINDAYGTPTYSFHLASRLRELAKLDVPGIYHVVNSGPGTSFEGFTRLALDLAGFKNVQIESVRMADLNRPAARPVNSRLRCLLSEQLRLAPMPPLEEGIREFVGFLSQPGQANDR